MLKRIYRTEKYIFQHIKASHLHHLAGPRSSFQGAHCNLMRVCLRKALPARIRGDHNKVFVFIQVFTAGLQRRRKLFICDLMAKDQIYVMWKEWRVREEWSQEIWLSLPEHFYVNILWYLWRDTFHQLVTIISHFQENGHQRHFESGVFFVPALWPLADTPVDKECQQTRGHKTTVYLSTFCDRM